MGKEGGGVITTDEIIGRATAFFIHYCVVEERNVGLFLKWGMVELLLLI